MINNWLYGVLLFLTFSAEAKIYKCTMPDGSVKYSDSSCDRAESVTESFGGVNYNAIEGAGRSNYEIHALCSKKYPHDDYMRKACVNTQAASRTQIIRIIDIYPSDSDPHKAIVSCSNRSKDSENRTNYQKTLKCIRGSVK